MPDYSYAGTLRTVKGQAIVDTGLSVYSDAAATVLAAIFDANGVALANPTSTSSRGRVEVYSQSPTLWYKVTGDTLAMLFPRAGESPWISVMDFGALGDGVNDDTNAILSAVSAGDNIYFPPCPLAYVVTGTIVCDNKTIAGFPSRSNLTSRIIQRSTLPTFEFTGAVANMSYMAVAGGMPPSFPPEYKPALNVKVGDGTEWMADGCFAYNWIQGWADANIEMNLCQGFTVTGNVIDGGAGVSAKLLGVENLVLTNNRISNCANTGILLAPAPIDTTAALNFDVTIANNFIDLAAGVLSAHFPAFGGMTQLNAGVCAYDAHALHISDNQFVSNYRGIVLSSTSGIGDADVRDVGISGNTFAGQLMESVLIDTCHRVTLSDNNFVPYVGVTGGRAGTTPELAECAHLKTVGACDRIVVTGGSMIGNANRTTGVHFSATTTVSAVDMLMYEGLDDAVIDDASANTIGTLIG
jgi:hypothetical protein